ncbi:hypothetical protein Gogos_019328, partial [Gossypium gossypioides]|nr:hypothetical protein [Gossypium gossypioides]
MNVTISQIACMNISYSGKLLMQSYLDVILAKFDNHVKDLSEFYSARILSHGFTIVVSRPGVSASKDDMRFCIRGLLTRMKIGDTEMKKQTLGNLYNILVKDERYVKLIIEIGDIMNIVVQFLNSSEIEIHREASNIVNLVSGFYLYKGFLLKAGIIAHGRVTALLKICLNSDFGGELIGRFIAEEGAISTFIKLVTSREDLVQESTLKVTSRLCYASEEAKKAIGDASFIPELVKLLDAKSYEMCSIATKTLHSL